MLYWKLHAPFMNSIKRKWLLDYLIRLITYNISTWFSEEKYIAIIYCVRSWLLGEPLFSTWFSEEKYIAIIYCVRSWLLGEPLFSLSRSLHFDLTIYQTNNVARKKVYSRAVGLASIEYCILLSKMIPTRQIEWHFPGFKFRIILSMSQIYSFNTCWE